MDLNRQNLKKILVIITFALLLLWTVLNFNMVINFLEQTFNIIFPFILGIGIAFVLNILTKFF